MKPARPALLKQSQFRPPKCWSLRSRDEDICGSQEAVVHPQAADRPAGPADPAAAALHSTGEGEAFIASTAFNQV